MVGRRCAGTGQMGAGRLAVAVMGLMQRVFPRGSGHDERRAPWVWTRRSLKAGVLRCGSRSGHGTSASRPKDGIDVLVTMSSGRNGQQVGGMEGGGGSGTYICAQDCDVLQATEVRPQWSGGERSRRSESTFPTPSVGQDRAGAEAAGPRTCRAAGPGEWVAGRQRAGAGCAGREPAGTPQSMGRTEGLRSRSGHGWGSMRDCGGNRKEPGRIGVESLTSAVYASALRALCVLVRGVSALRAGPGPSEPWRA